MSRPAEVNTGDIACVICQAKPGELHRAELHDAELGVAGRRIAGTAGPGSSSSSPPAPPRLNLSEVTRRLLELQAKPSRERSSVTVTRNARHVYQFEVTVYAGDTGAETPDEAKALALRLVDELEAKYPTPSSPPAPPAGEGS